LVPRPCRGDEAALDANHYRHDAKAARPRGHDPVVPGMFSRVVPELDARLPRVAEAFF